MRAELVHSEDEGHILSLAQIVGILRRLRISVEVSEDIPQDMQEPHRESQLNCF